MIRCINCGNEIVCNRSVCGFCGMPVKKEKNSVVLIVGLIILSSFLLWIVCLIGTFRLIAATTDIMDEPQNGEYHITITDDTDWGRDVMTIPGIKSVDELEWRSAAEGELQIERNEDGEFFLKKGELEVGMR